MKLLAVESADGSASIAYCDGDQIEYRHSGEMRDSLSWFMQQVETLKHDQFQDWTSLDGLACCVGPGGFTGVRVAVAYVQGLALASGLACYPVNSLEAMAMEVDCSKLVQGQRVWLALDARMNELYLAAFRLSGATLVSDSDLRLISVNETPGLLGTDDLLAGPGFEAYADRFEQSLLSGVSLSALGVGRVAAGMSDEQSVVAASLQPVYLRNKVAQTLKERGL